jgi:Na+-driven multidrug efflux pump
MLNLCLISYSLPCGIGVATATYTANEMGAGNVIKAKVNAFLGILQMFILRTFHFGHY